MVKFECQPRGPFDLANQNLFFGGWLSPDNRPGSIVMAFPVEGWKGSAAVVLRQEAGGRVAGEVHLEGRGAPAEASEAAWNQALAALSLDVDGAGWPDAGRRDRVLARLQDAFKFLRPVLFHSPYEAAAAFVIGHRISIRQGRAIRQAIAVKHGQRIQAGAAVVHAFPSPQVLRGLQSVAGVSAAKLSRLHGIAEAALEGWLDRSALRALEPQAALEKLCTLDGIGGFFSQGILFRGAGSADAVTDDEMTRQAFKSAFDLSSLPERQTVLRLAQPWAPYRMWGTVLLHVWYRSGLGGPHASLRHRARGSDSSGRARRGAVRG